MREHHPLSPHRPPRRPDDTRRRQIITAVPNVMWAIAATQVSTVQHGKVWIFGVAERWNAGSIGWHMTKSGTRLEATQALDMAARLQFGHLSAGVARGLALRHDRGSNFMVGHFQKQARFWSIASSHAFVREPETNGAIERLFRTMEEQAIHGRVF
jgi:transposase InsO family protein